MKRVTVITGGSTPERPVALAGAAQVVAALRGLGYVVAVVDTCQGLLSAAAERELLSPEVGSEPPSSAELASLARRENLPRLVELEAVRGSDVLFLVLHGRQGEGGAIQSLLELAGLEFTGSDSLGSALAMDKEVSKRLFAQAGVPTPRWRCWPVGADALHELIPEVFADQVIAEVGLPLVVKPSRVGSTVGLSLVREPGELDRAVGVALGYDREVLLEEFIAGRELTVGVLADRALGVGEIVPVHEIFDFECKYTPGMAAEIFPAPLDPALTTRLRDAALAVHRLLKLRDFSRVDFRLAPDGRFYCLEANTLPGMTRTSLLPQSAAVMGISFPELCDVMVKLALERRESR